MSVNDLPAKDGHYHVQITPCADCGARLTIAAARGTLRQPSDFMIRCPACNADGSYTAPYVIDRATLTVLGFERA